MQGQIPAVKWLKKPTGGSKMTTPLDTDTPPIPRPRNRTESLFADAADPDRNAPAQADSGNVEQMLALPVTPIPRWHGPSAAVRRNTLTVSAITTATAPPPPHSGRVLILRLPSPIRRLSHRCLLSWMHPTPPDPATAPAQPGHHLNRIPIRPASGEWSTAGTNATAPPCHVPRPLPGVVDGADRTCAVADARVGFHACPGSLARTCGHCHRYTGYT